MISLTQHVIFWFSTFMLLSSNCVKCELALIIKNIPQGEIILDVSRGKKIFNPKTKTPEDNVDFIMGPENKIIPLRPNIEFRNVFSQSEENINKEKWLFTSSLDKNILLLKTAEEPLEIQLNIKNKTLHFNGKKFTISSLTKQKNKCIINWISAFYENQPPSTIMMLVKNERLNCLIIKQPKNLGSPTSQLYICFQL